MRIFLVATVVAAMITPAYAQYAPMGANSGKPNGAQPPRPQQATVDPEQKKRDDKAFNDAVKRIPGPDKKYDPWGTVRNAGDK